MSLLLSVLVGMCSIGWGSAYSIGNISVVCDTMMPGHGYVPQNTTPPFRITASNTTYAPGDTITVSLSSTQSGTVFVGFMLQALRTVNGAPVGSFSSSNNSLFRLHSCSSVTNSTISHATGADKAQFVATWVAPPGSSPGNIQFCATFVKNFVQYWTMVKSPVITSASTVISVSALVLCSSVLTALTVIFRTVS
ncbi:putative ferric-chelate reductase 1 [Astyanax mexicanus]|uniref:Putative ferric-chelate reductase 1 n=1 Tax=Astyanax mexicanus TaxID=7994 RepID=A0A8T2L1I9_ASTMX|nr:putative ferric-chelate reductase 1 [Astyanax mexicanus]